MVEPTKQPYAAQRLVRGDWPYPDILLSRLGEDAPALLTAIGPVEFLANSKTALFCSAHAPGDAILRTHDAARRLRDEGATVISGFHSPIEKDCLRILLRGAQPIIICPARAIKTMRIPTECRSAFESGRILFLSPFASLPKRITRESATIRNQLVAALADRAFVAYASKGGQMERLTVLLQSWSVSIL